MSDAHKVTPMELLGIRLDEVTDRLKQAEADVFALQGAKQVLEEILTELISNSQADVLQDGGKYTVPIQSWNEVNDENTLPD